MEEGSDMQQEGGPPADPESSHPKAVPEPEPQDTASRFPNDA